MAKSSELQIEIPLMSATLVQYFTREDSYLDHPPFKSLSFINVLLLQGIIYSATQYYYWFIEVTELWK